MTALPVTASARASQRDAGDRGRHFTLQAADGQALAATAYGAMASTRAVVLAAATGVPQGFYRAFASWLAEQGVAVYTFDYRGVARSRPARLRGFKCTFADWALDIDILLGHALARHAQVSLIGHSIGGLLGPMALLATRLQRLVLVGAQTAYWRDWPQPQRWPMALLWHGVMPLVTATVGYFPGRALRLGEDLPRGVALQWAARPWRDPFDTDEGRARYARVLPPVHLLAPSDDHFATPAALQRVQQQLTGAAVQRHEIHPADGGLKRIGHFGLFRPAAATLWPRLRDMALT